MKDKPRLCSTCDGASPNVPDESNITTTYLEYSSSERPSSAYRSSPHCKRPDGGSWRSSNASGERAAASAARKGHRHVSKDTTNSEGERCRTARSLAIRWLSLLMQKSSDPLKHQAFHGRNDGEQGKWGCGKHTSRTDTTDESCFPEFSFAEVAKKNGVLSSVCNVAGGGGSNSRSSSSNSAQVENISSPGASLHLTSTFEPVPEEENSLPQLLLTLREIALTGVTLRSFSVRKDDTSSNGVVTSVVASGHRSVDVDTDGVGGDSGPPLSGSDGQWEEIRMHFDEVRRLVQNRDELTSVLDTALGVGWCLDAEPAAKESAPTSNWAVTLQSTETGVSSHTPLRCASPSAKTKGSKELQQDIGVASVSSTLNYNAPPFESRMRLVTTGVAPAVEPPLKLPEASACFPSSPPLRHENSEAMGSERAGTRRMSATGAGKATSPPSASSQTSSPAATFKLESREDMLRRRTAAAAAAAASSVAQYAHTPNGNYYVGRSRVSWSGPVSPNLPFMNPPLGHSLCPFDYLLVLDFEATCEEKTPLSYLHEIIEFPVVVVDVKLQRVVAEFHRFVKPKVHPQLSEFCRCLTGIEQENIDNAASLEDVIRQFERWHAQTIPPGSRTMLATDGPTDLREFMYVHSVGRQGIRFPSMFYQWIDVKRAFAHFFQCQQGKIKAMLDVLHCPFEGRLHSGIDDARNIAKIVIRMLQVGCSFCEIPLSRLPYGSPALSTGVASPSVAPSGSTDGDASL